MSQQYYLSSEPPSLGSQKSSSDCLLSERYRIEGPLGQGRASEVYQAWDLHRQARVAIKVRQGPDLRAAEALTRHEAAMGTRIHDRRHVIQVLDLFSFASRSGLAWGLVMELAEGGTLRDLLQASAPVTSESLFRIALEISKGAKAIHACGLVHGDLKPENVQFVGGITKIGDFESMAPGGASSGACGGLGTTGTSGYRPPEMPQNVSAGLLGDIYAIGVILDELAGCAEHQHRTGRSPETALWRAVRQVAAGCRHHTSRSRFRDGQAIVAALQAIAPLSAPQVTTGETCVADHPPEEAVLLQLLRAGVRRDLGRVNLRELVCALVRAEELTGRDAGDDIHQRLSQHALAFRQAMEEAARAFTRNDRAVSVYWLQAADRISPGNAVVHQALQRLTGACPSAPARPGSEHPLLHPRGRRPQLGGRYHD